MIATLLRDVLADLVVLLLVSVGVFYMVLSTVGIIRMPDTYGRLHVAGKAGTLGIICILLAAGLYLGTLGAIVRAVALVVLFYVTAPVAAHLIGRVVWRAKGSQISD